ncbi:hypothetical protein BGX34_001901 [Mortierella sp. NVP85]|nr:hypothetical protein BGX34_001901 [Mortierella sp. NVP85]
MAECKATSRPARAPLQERKGISNVTSGPDPLGKANAPILPQAGFSSKIGQENTVATFIPSSTAALARKPIAPQKTVSDGTDFQRARMASLQKPSAGVSSSTSKMYNASNHSIPHPLLKVRQTAPLPESTSTSVGQRGHEKLNPQQAVSKRPTQGPARPQPKHPYGSPEWIQGLALSLQSFRFYFDNVDSSIGGKLTKTLNIYGSTVRMFFSHDVTHVVTTRKIPSTDDFLRSKNNHDKTPAQNQTSGTPTPPTTTLSKQALKFPPLPTAPSAENCVLLKAMEYRIKIWSLERMMDFLTPLMSEPIVQKDNRNLQDFLRYEKVYGLTTTQNDDSLRPDYHVFRGPFVLIEDSTGRHRTILAYEYPDKDPQSHSNRLPWPKLHIQSTTRSPYLWYEEKPQRSKKKLEKGINDTKEAVVKDTKDGQENPEENAPKTHLERSVAPSALVSGIVNSVTSNAVSTHSAAVKTQGMEGTQGAQDRVLEQLGKRVLNSTKGEAGVITADTKKSEFVRPGDIIKSTKSAKPNVGRGADTGKAVPFQLVAPSVNTGAASNLQQVPTPTADTTKQMNEHGLKPTPVVKTSTQPVARKDYRPLGFCENCRGYYHDFEKHIATAEHRRYAHDASKFEQLDILLSQLQRKPKAPLPPAETDEDAICDTSRGQTSSPETAAVAEIADTEGLIKGSVIENAPVATDEEDLEPFKAPQPKNNPGHPTEARGLDLEQHQQLDTGVDTCTEHAQTSTSKDVTEDEHKDEDIVKPNVAEDDESELSSVLSRLDVSETGEEPPLLEADADGDGDADADDKEVTEVHQPVTSSISHTTAVPLLTDPQDLVKTPTQVEPESHSLLCLQFRTRNLDSEATSQLETDVTQPDEQFLGGSVVDSQVTDPVMPIRLSISMSSIYTDFPEAMGTPIRHTYVIQEQPEGENDGLDDDDVALLKSPSAGRGTYARAQAAQLHKTFETAPAPASGSLKRKFEAILAEERAARQPGHVDTFTADSPNTARPILYNDSLQSRLLLQSVPHHPTTLPPPNFSIRGFDYQQPQMLPLISDVPSSPLSFEGLQASSPTCMGAPPSTHEAAGNCPPSSAFVEPQELQEPYDWNTKFEGVQYNFGYSAPHSAPRNIYDSPVSQLSQRRYVHRENNRVLPSLRSMMPPSAPQFQPALPPLNDHFPSGCVVPTTPTSHMSSLHSFSTHQNHPEGHTPQGPNYYGMGHLSSSQSPSQRSLYRSRLAVMSHAEQEQERCYHHARGNHLPEPAGQKKLRSSSDHVREFEEYGEGCEVFIE